MRIPRSAWSPIGWPSERPANDPRKLEAWCYTDRFSYRGGDEVHVHAHTTAPTFSLRVVRDGLAPVTVHEVREVLGGAHETPQDAFAIGCGWPVATSFTVDASWPSGFYLVIIRAELGDEVVEREHFFVVREPAPSARIALVVSTATMLAYNDWGGANSYRGMGDYPHIDVGSAYQSTQRPVGRGMLRKPAGAPRVRLEHPRVPPRWQPRYEDYEWAMHNGYSRHHADSFWATYEREFVRFAEAEGVDLAYLTQHDLHFDPDALDGYDCAVFVGHDEYHSWEMREAMDALLDRGGNIARFGGNFLFQVRYDDDGKTQICFKNEPEADPVWGTEQQTRLSAFWDHPMTGWPVVESMGTRGLGGVYHRYGVAVPRGAGGYTVYRPYHWSFEGTDLYYGDILGGQPSYIASFEVDGLDYTFRDGEPFATGADGADPDVEILALVPAVRFEEDRWETRVPLGDPGLALLDKDGDLDMSMEGVYWARRPDGTPRPAYGCGAMVCFERGAGTMYNTGASEWVAGLLHQDPFVEQITRNVLRRLGRLDG